MIYFQDWEKYAERSEQDRIAEVMSIITEHQGGQKFKEAKEGEDYFKGRNTTIKTVEHVLFNARGKAVPDYLSANHKIPFRFFHREVKQELTVLLGNGISWGEGVTNAFTEGEDFDEQVMELVRTGIVQGTAFGFWNLDHLEVYPLTEFAPLYDEEDGALKAGVRFWQVAPDKPLRATLFEMDGYTDYRYDDGEGTVLHPKRPYILNTISSPADGTIIFDGDNYPSFPVVPLYVNQDHESELNPIRATIDAYDLINSGYANDIDDANLIYWTITNAGGMDDADLVSFLDKLRKLRVAQLDDDQQIQSHSVAIPYEGREAILSRLERQLYEDSMSLNVANIASGAVTATQIRAAYEPLNQKLDDLERYVTDFLRRLGRVAGVTDSPTYERSILINQTETIQVLLQAANYLDSDYITRKIMTLLGDKDKIPDVMAARQEADLNRLTMGQPQTADEDAGDGEA